VHFKVLSGVGHSVKNRPGFVLSVLLYRQFALRLGERGNRRPIRRER
jgi:hypothetical protein